VNIGPSSVSVLEGDKSGCNMALSLFSLRLMPIIVAPIMRNIIGRNSKKYISMRKKTMNCIRPIIAKIKPMAIRPSDS